MLSEPLDRLCALLPAAGLVADLGCGPGRHLGEIGARGMRPVGLDLSTGMLRQARGRSGEPLVQADLRSLPLRDGCLDGAWSSYALLHLDDQGLAQALGEVTRVLRPGGCAALVLAGAGKAAEGGSFLEPVAYAPGQSRWFHVREVGEAVRAARGAGLDVLEADVVMEAKRSPIRLLLRRLPKG